MVAAVLAIDIVDDLAAAVDAEVNIDIGHADALGIQKSLEEQAVFNGVNIGDAQAIGHHAACGAASARADGYLLTLGIADKVRDDEEIIDKAHLLYHGKLIVKLLSDLVSVGGIAFCKALVAQLFKISVAVRFTVGELKARQLVVAELKIVIAHIRNACGIVDCIGILREKGAHLSLVL